VTVSVCIFGFAPLSVLATHESQWTLLPVGFSASIEACVATDNIGRSELTGQPRPELKEELEEPQDVTSTLPSFA
jgi:hypothetical protein